MADLQTLLFSDTKLLAAAIVSAAVSASISLGSRLFEVRDKLAAVYKHEQRIKLKKLTGRYYGRTLRSAVNLNNRLWNLYQTRQLLPVHCLTRRLNSRYALSDQMI